ncbi:MAG: acetyl-CoA carboxylase biotin carboxylase subunit [Rhodothermia bacterium]
MPRIRKILVANRGEIAIRVFRTCRDLGIGTVAVYSDADRAALHVRMADEAYRIGPAPSSESYLVIDAVLDAAARSGADAVHPGYGFLSENPEFAERCTARGFTFIGPPASAMRAMGDKVAARKLMQAAGVPMAPGTIDPVDDAEQALAVAADIGYPVLIKATAGGGGKGMRIVHSDEQVAAAFEAAQREATAAFSNGGLYVEKYIQESRHVEIQILADHHGSAIHLFERECSIQRRHQKVIEESPSCVLDESLRARMGETALQATLACGYAGAGTVEFLLDDAQNFFFMEMNARLQVEHAVTEAVTGIDLVAEQIRIAEGLPLRLRQDDLELRGHAIECRIYAEDPCSSFLPNPGTLVRHSAPAGPRVRVDSGVEEGVEIPIHYDPMIAKVVTWGPDRDQAINTMLRALDEYRISGVQTTIPFCRYVLEHADFRSGNFSTHFVEDRFSAEALGQASEHESMTAALASVLTRKQPANGFTPATDGVRDDGWSPWAANRRRTRMRG